MLGYVMFGTYYRKAAAINGTDGRTPDRYIDPEPHTVRAVSVITGYVNYTVSQKKQDTKLLPILTSPNINRFSKFFHC